jgi:hypothetical protein
MRRLACIGFDGRLTVARGSPLTVSAPRASWERRHRVVLRAQGPRWGAAPRVGGRQIASPLPRTVFVRRSPRNPARLREGRACTRRSDSRMHPPHPARDAALMLYRGRAAVEPGFGRLKGAWGLLPLRVRGAGGNRRALHVGAPTRECSLALRARVSGIFCWIQGSVDVQCTMCASARPRTLPVLLPWITVHYTRQRAKNSVATPGGVQVIHRPLSRQSGRP